MGAALAELCLLGNKTLNTPKWDILATGVAIYLESKLRKLKLQTYQSFSLAQVREKPPTNVGNRENGVRREGKFPSLAENAAQKRRRTTSSDIYTSQAT